MNIIMPDEPNAQPITVTPRLLEADSYEIDYKVEGVSDLITIPCSGVLDGSFLTLSPTIDISENNFIWFKVYALDDQSSRIGEIYRGKAIAVIETIKFSIYSGKYTL